LSECHIAAQLAAKVELNLSNPYQKTMVPCN